MRIRNRSLIILFSNGLERSSIIILGIILVRLISQESLGTFRQVFLVQAFLAGVISLQLNNSLYYFLPKYGPEKRRTLLLQTFLMTLALAIITAVVMFLGSGWIADTFHNPELVSLIKICAIYPFGNRLAMLVPAFMISLDRPVRSGVYNIISHAGQMGVVIIAFTMGCSLATVIWLRVVVQVIMGVIGCIDMARLSPQGKWRLDNTIIKEQIQYTFPLLATSLVGVLNLQFGKLLISSFFDPALYAVYSCGAVQLPIVSVITISISSAIMPNLVSVAEKGNIKAALNIWQEAARKCSLIIFPCFAFFFVCAYDFIVLLYGQSYDLAVWPFSIYLFTLPIRVAVYSTLFRAIGKTKYIAYQAVLALSINIIISTTLVWLGQKSLLSFIGPSVGSAVASLASMVFLLATFSRIAKIPIGSIMRWKELSQVFLISVLAGLIIMFIPLPELHLLVKLIVQAGLFMAILIVFMLGSKMLHKDEIELIQLPFNRMWKLARGGQSK